MWRLFETCFGSLRPHVYPEIALGQLVERETEIRVVELPGETFNVTEFELVAIAAIARQIAPRLIVEFGTADGRTTLNLARNSPPDCRVVTINLPLDEDSGHAQDTAVGSRFLGTEEATRIVQVWVTPDQSTCHATSGVASWSSSTPITRKRVWWPTVSPR